MIEPTPGATDLEAGLAEIDRRLRQIQEELAEPGPSEPERSQPETSRPQGRAGPLAAVLQRSGRDVPSASDDERGSADEERQRDAHRARDARAQLEDLSRQLHALADLRDKLLASIRELVDGYQLAAHVQPGASPSIATPGAGSSAVAPLGPGPAPGSAPKAEMTLSAGPFASLEAVRAFERAVAALPGVRETLLRGYEGADRAILDVRLGRRS